MRSFIILLRKEWRELARNYKLLWIPVLFLFFGMLEPVTNYYLPEIMKSVGNLPEGAEFNWPTFTGEDIYVSLLSQYQFSGILAIVFGFMGAISGERKHGTATFLYVRPISFTSYFMSKWTAINSTILASLAVGLMGASYYIYFLYGSVDWRQVLAYAATYALWLIFVTTIVLACSAAFTTGAGATISVFAAVFMPLIDSLIGAFWPISPWKLPIYAGIWFQENPDLSDVWLSISFTVALITILVVAGIYAGKRNIGKSTV